MITGYIEDMIDLDTVIVHNGLELEDEGLLTGARSIDASHFEKIRWQQF